jgi:plastocyanin
MHSKLALAVTAGALLLFAACSPAATTPAATTPAATAAATTAAATTAAATSAAASGSTAAGACAQGANGTQKVTIAGFAFSPSDLTVKVGDSVTWTNNDNTAHTATADDGSFDCGTIGAGQSFTFTFATAGTFAYHCKIHPSMVAKITAS